MGLVALSKRAVRPQEAIIRFGTWPSECDVVVVVLWSRLGTHLNPAMFQKANGEPYLSGTEWEYEDACKGRPETLVYWRAEEPMVGMKDPARAEKFRQYELIEQFFERFMNSDRSFRGSVTPYVTSTEFKERLATDLMRLLRDRIGVSNTSSVPVSKPTPIWTDSPYPGLRPFMTEQAAIFFGRLSDD
jgi:hypothetical protein